MYIIISMILSGNSLLLLFIILRKLWKGCFDVPLQREILKMCLIFFLLPFSLLFDLLSIVRFQLFGINNTDLTRIIGKNPVIIFTPDRIVTNPAIHTMLTVFGLWILFACILLGYHLICYLKFRKMVYASAISIPSVSLCSFLTEQRKALRIKHEVRFFKSNQLNSAHTMGMIKPIIILPANSSHTELKIMILHELRHIKNHDTFIQFLCLICKGLYWFNPFIYLLDHLLRQTSELACDEWVTQQLDNNSKLLYAQLIITTSRKKTAAYQYSTPLSGNCEIIQKRIDCIMKKPEKNTKRKFLSVIIAMTTVTLSGIPALASPPLQMLSIDEASFEAISCDSSTDISIYTGTVNIDPYLTYSIFYDKQFTDIRGKTYDATESFSHPEIKCDHTFVEGTYSLHKRKSDGGCVNTFYTALRCTKCSHVKVSELINEIISLECPH